MKWFELTLSFKKDLIEALLTFFFRLKLYLKKIQQLSIAQRPTHLLFPSSHPPTPLLPREVPSIRSDYSPPLMLACMGVKSLQASSAHPWWETLQEESSMSKPILACIAMHSFYFFLFVFVLSPFALLPRGVTINWPFIQYVQGGQKQQWF